MNLMPAPSSVRQHGCQIGDSPVKDQQTDSYAWTDTLNLADQLQLTVYDAAYLELARRRTLPLATLDQQLRTAATAVGEQCSVASLQGKMPRGTCHASGRGKGIEAIL
jgi:hypothetical protein